MYRFLTQHFPDRLAPTWRGPLPITLLLIAHFLFLMLFFEPAISTPDANGYMAQARLIANQRRTYIAVESPIQFVGSHWMSNGKDRYYGQYPPGLPLLLGLVFRSAGPTAALVAIALMASSCLLAVYLFCRSRISAGWGLLAATVMAVNPWANAHALGADSHTAVCFFLVWGLVCLDRWDRTTSPWFAPPPASASA